MSDPVDHLKKLAKDLLREGRSGNAQACGRFRSIYSDYREVGDAALAEQLSLGRAQHVIAVEHGFKSWETVANSRPIELYLAITMARVPDLNDFGIGLYSDDRKNPRHIREAIMKADREALVASVDRVEHVVTWLRENVAPIKTLNKRRTSYGIKHVAEKDIGYLTNGVFIAAGIIAGYAHEIPWDSPNVHFGMSERSLKRLEDERIRNPKPYAWKMPNWTDSGKVARMAKYEIKKALLSSN